MPLLLTFEPISHIVLVLQLLTLNKEILAENSKVLKSSESLIWADYWFIIQGFICNAILNQQNGEKLF